MFKLYRPFTIKIQKLKVKILAFGISKDILGTSAINLELDQHATVGQLKAKLCAEHKEFQKLSSLMIAVNSEYASTDTILNENDEIALIPPVSGG